MGEEIDAIFTAAHRWRLRYAGSDAMAAWLRIQRAEALMTAELNRLLKPFDLNAVRYEVLALMTWTGKPVLIGQISDWLMIHPTSATNNIERLEATGYVRRIPNPADRRSTLVELTSSGQEVMEEATAIVVEHRFGLASLEPGDHVQLDRILSRLSGRPEWGR
ncbi:MAG TPA: MarR family transcriptional regulator [Solirubrobacteraceae bacterium]|nr:MarR family transcriptional regulator [Solirubrobacteraceae bacterium]